MFVYTINKFCNVSRIYANNITPTMQLKINPVKVKEQLST